MNQTLATAIRRWLSAKRGVVREATWLDYRDKAERYLVRPLGSLPLRQLSPLRLHQFYEASGQAGLARRTVCYVHEILLQVLDLAVRDAFLVMNPARQVRPPSYRRQPGARLTSEQLRSFRVAASQDEHAALWLLLAGTGIRPGEALALTWDDLDLARGVARITHTLRSLPNGRWQRAPLRCPAHVREIVLPIPVRDRLIVQRRRETNALSGKTLEGWIDQLVFASADGRPLRWNSLSTGPFKALLRQAHLPDVTGYSLRHAVVVALIEEGLTIRDVRRVAGYSSAMSLSRLRTDSVA